MTNETTSDLPESHHRGRETSNALVEVRSVITRNARAIERLRQPMEPRAVPAHWDDEGYHPGSLSHDRDPDQDEMIKVLTECQHLLGRWQAASQRKGI